MNHKAKKIAVLVVILIVAVGLFLFGMLMGQKHVPTAAHMNQTEQTELTLEVNEETVTPAPTDVPKSTITSKYLNLQYPAELVDSLLHEQDVYESRITDAFYMLHGEKDIPLFRIDFGDEKAGEWLGMLKTENGNIDVTSVVFVIADEEFAGLSEADQQLYSSCMNAYSVMLEGIMADPRFTAEKPLAVGEDAEAKTTYWSLTLPSNMTVVETNENGTYAAMFYGEVAGERTALYQVRIGDNKAESELGLFEIDGVKKPISVGSFDLSEKPNWTGDDYSAAYRMMDTINHVIETIMNSAQFSISGDEPVQAPDAAQ